MAKFFHDTEPLKLESGEVLPELTIAYDTYGEGFKPLPTKDEIQNI